MSTIPFRFFVVSVVAHSGLLLAPSGDWLPTPPLLSTTPLTVQLGMAQDVAAPSPAHPADRDPPLLNSSPATAVTRPLRDDRIATVIAVAEPRQIDSGREALVDTSNNIPDTNTGGHTKLNITALQTDIPEPMPAIDEPQHSSATSPTKQPPLPAGQPSTPPASTTVAAVAPPAPTESITIPPTDSVAETDSAERTDTASHTEPVRVAAAAPLPDRAAPGAIAARARREIEALLALRFRYPALARKHGWEGRVQIRVTLSASGRIDTTQIVQSSGYRVLDRNALKTLRRIDRLPGDAQWLQGHDLSLDIPIRYQLING